MTDTNTLTPTDAELMQVIKDVAKNSAINRDGSTSLRIARAVLAKWGYACPVSQPVAAPSEPLTDSQIADIYFEALGQHLREQDRKMVTRFTRAIEANHGIKATNPESNK